MKKVFVFFALLSLASFLKAEDDGKVGFSIGGDVVSSYVWRGEYIAGTSIQPEMKLELGDISFSTWGSVDISGQGYKEVNLIASYSRSGFQLDITDYWCMGERSYKYFMYESHRTDHAFEATLGYILPVAKFPLSISWSTLFAGADYTKANQKRAYSSYLELAYPFEIKDISLEASLGFTPWEGVYADNLSVVSLALKAGKEIRLSDSFSLPVFGQLIANPRMEDAFFVFGICF